jgi:hypothetical protein
MQKPDIYHCNDTLKSSNDTKHKRSFDFTSQKKETKKFLDALAKKTACKITLTFLEYQEEKTRGFVLNNKQPVKIEEAFSLLEQENAWYKNVVYKKSVLWNFSKENQYFNIVLIDDIQDIETFKRRDFFLLWNTSNKFQAAFLLDRGVTSEDVKKIQRMLIKDYGGDFGSLGASHNRKLPGFYNTKYPDAPYMQIQYLGTRVLNANHILEKYKEIYGKEEEITKPQQRVLTVEQMMKQLQGRGTPKKTWQDFFKEKQNKSQADIAYAIYLIDRGYTDEQIRQALLNESEDLDIRKKGHLEDYLSRTLIAARTYYENFKGGK